MEIKVIICMTPIFPDTQQPLNNTIANTVIAKHLCCVQTRMFRLYRKMTINNKFLYINYTFCLDTTFLGSAFKLSYIQNCLIINMFQRIYTFILLMFIFNHHVDGLGGSVGCMSDWC